MRPFESRDLLIGAEYLREIEYDQNEEDPEFIKFGKTTKTWWIPLGVFGYRFYGFEVPYLEGLLCVREFEILD